MAPPRPRHYWLGFLAAPLAVAGCGGQVAFDADRLSLVDGAISAEYSSAIDVALVNRFGTPDEPAVPAGLAEVLDTQGVADAAGPVESHTEGVTQGLFRRHCARCHGLTGDGRGAAALYQSPYPRDFRRGVFKYKSTERAAAPTDEDLHATLVRGVAGAAMPSFRLLKDDERRSLVAYVKYLTSRGRVEQALIEFVAEEYDADWGDTAMDDSLSDELLSVADEAIRDTADWWQAASSRRAELPDFAGGELASPERIEAGRELFHNDKIAGCAKCHGANGRGEDNLKEFDLWNGRRAEFARLTGLQEASAEALLARAQAATKGADKLLDRHAERAEHLAERHDVEAWMLPPRVARARVLAGGVLRGGREADTLFRVIHEGVAGTPMPAAGDALSDEQIWDLVAYLQSLAAETPESVSPATGTP